MLTSLIANEIDVLLLSETKLDETFPLEQFLISGFAKPLRLDRNSKGGGIMLFIRDNITFRLLKHGNLPSNTEAFFIEINLRKKKWLMCWMANGTPQYVLVCSSATNFSFFLCMPLPGKFLVCTGIGIRFIFLVLNFQVLVVCFITTFIKSFKQLLSWKLLVFFITFFTFRFTLRNGWDLLFIIGDFLNGVSSSSEMLSKKSCIACSCCCSDKNRCFFFGGILSLFLTSFHFSY